MTVKQFEQFHQRQGRTCPAVFIARKCVDAAAEDLRCSALIKSEFFSHLGDKTRIDNRRIDLFRELTAHRGARSVHVLPDFMIGVGGHAFIKISGREGIFSLFRKGY